jgi:hypothetical protein
MNPTASPAIWPYPHRTVAEVDEAEARLLRKGPTETLDRLVGLAPDKSRRSIAIPQAVRRDPCPRCGSRPSHGCAHGWTGEYFAEVAA